MRNAFIHSLSALAQEDSSVMLLTGDLGFTVFEDFTRRFRRQFLNMGVAEQNMIAVAAGLALSGKRVFVYSIIPFVTLRCLEHIRNDLCLHALPVTIVGMGSGYSYGHMGPSHHALEDIAALRSLPGMTVICPGDGVETAAAVEAVRSLHGPCYLRLGKSGEPAVHDGPIDFRVGRAIQLRSGSDLSILATGTMLEMALATATMLKNHDLQARVLSMHTVKPMDVDAVRQAAEETPLIVTIEEHRQAGGFGGAVAEALAAYRERPPHLLCCAPDDVSSLCASREALRVHAGLTPDLLAKRIMATLHSHRLCIPPSASSVARTITPRRSTRQR